MSHESGRDPAVGERLTAGLERARDALSDRMLELGQKKASAATDTTYNVVFSGKLTLAEAQALANMANFFKIGADSAKRLLQAGRVLKSYPNKAQADKLAALLTRAGAECRVEMEMPEEDEPSAVQQAAFALQGIKIPAIKLPDYHQIGRKQWLALGAVCVLIVALTLWLVLRAPTMRGDTAAEYQANIDRMLAHADDPQQAHAIQQAILLLTDSSRKAQSESSTSNPDMAARLIYAPVAGKTAADMLALAEARLEKQRVAFRVGIAEADQKIAAINQQLADIAPGNKVVLGKIEVVSAAFGWPAGAPAPTLAFSIRNNSSENLMRVYLQGYLYDENDVLLVSNAVTYSIASGVDAGTSVTATLPTQMDSPWALASLREKTGLVFKLRVANAENRQGKILGVDYRPLENDRQRHTDWKNKVQQQLDAVKL